MEVEGGSYDNNELPPLLPQREPVELTFRGQLLVQLNSWGGGRSHTQGRHSLRAPSFPSEFTAAFINQEGSNKGLGL